MLEKLDLSETISKESYQSTIPKLEKELGRLQRQAKKLEIPLLIVFEGWDAAGKGTIMNRLLLAMDARGFNVHVTRAPNEEEKLRPFLWRFWTRTPARGRTAVFDRSWYMRVLSERVDRAVKKPVWSRVFNEINSFERQLVDGDTVIVKFFFHISQKEQRKRFKQLQRNPATLWRVGKGDWRQHKQYKKYLLATEDMLAKTDTAVAPWTIVPTHDRRLATVRVFRTVIHFLQQKVSALEQQKSQGDPIAVESQPISSVLDGVDLTLSLARAEYQEELKRVQARLSDLEHRIYLNRVPVVVVYEGWDASGKGGSIRRLVQGMDPRGYEVIPIAAPTELEKAHPYLWRFWSKFPKAGHIAIFDRSWYGRLLVERVEGLASVHEWKRAYKEINEMEEQWANFGTVIVKFWIHIGVEEQLRRFRERQNDDSKRWKLNDEDWRNREKWAQYKSAVDEMLYRTSTAYAPWTIIEGNSKPYARIKALRTVEKALEDRL